MSTGNSNSNDLTDSFQWDTVFAIKIRDVNAAIKEAGSSPAKMDYTMDDGTEVVCSFDDWSIDSSGDGSLIHLLIPVQTCATTMNEKTITINSFSVIPEVRLNFYDANQSDPNSTGIFQNLKVKSHQDSPDDQLISGVSLDFGQQKVSTILQGIITAAFQEWLSANIKFFDHIFATVNLNKLSADGSYQWLYPIKVNYAFLNNADVPDDSILGVLCITEKPIPDNLIIEVSHNSIPALSSAGFLISQSRLIQKMILPSLPSAFQGLTADDFNVTNQGKSIELKSIDKSFTVTQDGKAYTANLEAFILSLKGQQLTLHCETKTEIVPGIYASTSSDHTYELGLYTKKNGKQSITYKEIGKPVVIQSTSEDEGVTITEIITSIIAGIIVGILAFLTAGLVFVAVVIIGGLLVGLIATTSDIIRLIGTDDAPDISLLLLNCTQPIQWTGQKNFTLNSVALNGPLQLGGTFKG